MRLVAVLLRYRTVRSW